MGWDHNGLTFFLVVLFVVYRFSVRAQKYDIDIASDDNGRIMMADGPSGGPTIDLQCCILQYIVFPFAQKSTTLTLWSCGGQNHVHSQYII
jgi:hypothetical protein